jgi:hypothetical protein
MGRRRWLGPCLGAGLSVVVWAAPAVADTPAKVDSVTLHGDAVVGATLAPAVVVSGDPAPTIAYQWARCKAEKPNSCAPIAGAATASYTVADADVGNRLVVRVTAKNTAGTNSAKSAPTAVVVAAPQPTPTPDPTPTDPTATPQPDPTLGVTSDPGGTVANGVTTAVQARPLTVQAPMLARYLRPFPVVRVAGFSVRGGAHIDLFSVTAPRGTHVAISCLGRGCPVRRLSRGPGRFRQLERFLPVGVEITIRATRRGYIGKYVSFVVRSHAAPKRRDACLLPDRTRPTACPG